MNVPEPVSLQPGAPRHLPQETAKIPATTHAHTGRAVAQQLRTAILAGGLRPGAKLSERTLGEGTGSVPQHPARAVDRGHSARGSHDAAMTARIQAGMRLVFHALDGDPAFHAPFSISNAHIFAQWKAGHCEAAAEEMDGYLQQAQDQVLAAMPAESGGLP